MSGGGSSASTPPSDTTTTYIQDLPQWEQEYMTNLLGKAQAASNQPYQQFQGPQVADFTAPQTQSFSNIQNLVNNGQYSQTQYAGANSALQGAQTAGGIYGAASPYYQSAASYNPLAASAPYYQSAASYNPLQAGAGYEQAAALTGSPLGIQSYLSPYTNNVVQGLENQANLNWNQHIMPGVNDVFVGSGQFASGRNAQVLGQAANDFQTNLNSQVAQTLQSGYNTAGQQAQNEASLLGQLGSTAGNQAAQQAQNLQGIGSGLGSQTQAQATNLQNIGSGLGNLASTQASQLSNAGTALGNLGQQQLATGITANQALQAVGQQQQQQNQQNLNVAQQNFQNQIQYPEQQIGFLSNIIRGLPSAGGSSSQVASNPLTNNTVGSVSPLSQLSGGLLGVSGIGSAGGAGKKKGGLIKGYADGGSVQPISDADLNSMDVDPTPKEMPVPPMSADADQPISQAIAQKQVEIPQQQTPLVNINSDFSITPEQARGYQLLAAAKGMLTPAHSGAEAFGNALGNYAEAGLRMPQIGAQDIDLQNKQIGQQQQLYGLASQNAYLQSAGLPTIALPDIAGASDIQKRFNSAIANQQPQISPISGVNQSTGSSQSASPLTQIGGSGSQYTASQLLNMLQHPSLISDPNQAREVTSFASHINHPEWVSPELAKFAYAPATAGATAAAELPIKLQETAAQGNQARQTAQYEAGFKTVDVKDANGNTMTIPANMTSAVLGGGLQGPRTIPEAAKSLQNIDQKTLETMQPDYEAAQNGLGITQEIRKLGNIADKNPFTRGGPLEPATMETLNFANDIIRRSGLQPVDENELASAVGVNKLQTQLANAATKLLGAREAQQVYQKQLESNPGMMMSPTARNLLLDSMESNFKRVNDRYNVLQKSLTSEDSYTVDPKTKTYKTGVSSLTEYDKAHPSAEYANNATKSMNKPVYQEGQKATGPNGPLIYINGKWKPTNK